MIYINFICISIFCLFLFFIVFQHWLLKSKICNWLDQTNTASQDGISAIYLHQPTNQLHTLVSNSFGIRLIEQKAWVLDRRPCQWTCESYGQMEQTEIRTFGWFRKKRKGKKHTESDVLWYTNWWEVCFPLVTHNESTCVWSSSPCHEWKSVKFAFVLYSATKQAREKRVKWAIWKKSVWLRPFMPYLLWMNFSDSSLIKAL